MADIVAEFREKLVKARVNIECSSLQVDFEGTFLKGLRGRGNNPYAEYNWEVKPHSAVAKGNVIHGIPPVSKAEKLPWEEWFLWEGKPRHHVLYTVKKSQDDTEFTGAPDDKDHPKAVLGRKWYYVNDPDLSPVLFR